MQTEWRGAHCEGATASRSATYIAAVFLDRRPRRATVRGAHIHHGVSTRQRSFALGGEHLAQKITGGQRHCSLDPVPSIQSFDFVLAQEIVPADVDVLSTNLWWRDDQESRQAGLAIRMKRSAQERASAVVQ